MDDKPYCRKGARVSIIRNPCRCRAAVNNGRIYVIRTAAAARVNIIYPADR